MKDVVTDVGVPIDHRVCDEYDMEVCTVQKTTWMTESAKDVESVAQA